MSRRSWWAPLLALGAIMFALHALNHAFDIDEARSDARGLADTLVIAAGALALAWLARAAARSPAKPGPDRAQSGTA